MKDRIFHRYVTIAVAILLIITVAAKVHSTQSMADVHEWNYRAIQEIERTTGNSTNYTFIVLGDNKNSRLFDDMLDEINRENASFVVDTGDMVIKGERAYYDAFLKQVEKCNKPFLTVIGNHELYDSGRAQYYDIFGQFYYSFTVGDDYYIMLDDANEKCIEPWQMEWLEKELQNGQNYSHRFVFMHVPLYDPRDDGVGHDYEHALEDVNCANRLRDLFDQYNVTMIFAGHIHAYFNGTWGNTPYIITGGAGGEQIGGDDPAHYFYHYIRVHVSGNNVTYEVVRLRGPDFAPERPLYSIWLHLYVFLDVNALNIIIFVSAFYLGYYFVVIKKEWVSHNFLGKWREKRAEKKEMKKKREEPDEEKKI